MYVPETCCANLPGFCRESDEHADRFYHEPIPAATGLHVLPESACRIYVCWFLLLGAMAVPALELKWISQVVFQELANPVAHIAAASEARAKREHKRNPAGL